jgi:hypothetical protein
MSSCRTGRISWLISMLAGAAMLAPPARAGIFSKHTKVNPADRVPTLIATLRADQDERKRASAAEELRQYDPNMFPEIIPTLADIALRDPKSSVRLEAIQSLAKLRPVSQRAGGALEQATHDESVRVRLQARTLLWQYHMAGYRAGKTTDVSAPTNTIRTEEPPLAPPLDGPPISSFQKSITPSPVLVSPAPTKTPPPPTVGYVSPVTQPALRGSVWGATAPPKALSTQPAAVPLGPRPLPPGPAQVSASGPRPLPTGPEIAADNGPKPLPAGPADTAKPAKEAKEPSPEDGPDLSPP